MSPTSAHALLQNSTLKELALGGSNPCGERTYRQFLNTLRHNRTLIKLDISSESGAAHINRTLLKDIELALQKNKSLLQWGEEELEAKLKEAQRKAAAEQESAARIRSFFEPVPTATCPRSQS